jgi:hypothetical protein
MITLAQNCGFSDGGDQTAEVRCIKHGRNAGGVFFRPERGEAADAADYLCLHCWIEAGRPYSLSKEEFYRLQWNPPMDKR